METFDICRMSAAAEKPPRTNVFLTVVADASAHVSRISDAAWRFCFN